MKFSVVKKLNIGRPRSLLSVVLGGLFGLSVYSYWLVDILPSTSLKLLVFSVFAGIIGVIGYFILLEFWIPPRFSNLQVIDKLKVILWGTLIGSALLFLGTKAWTSPVRYIPFLLPEQKLEVSIPDTNSGSVPEISILWVTTSLGDISYDSMQFDGWEREENRLVLNDPVDNSLHWRGKTGADALILFRKSPFGGVATISWNEKAETVDLHSESTGTFQYKRQLDIPFYASVHTVWLVVLINFVMLGIVLYLLFLDQKHMVDERIRNSVLTKVSSGQQQKWAIEMTVVVLFVFLAFLLRVFNLENLYPYADEYAHLGTVKQLLGGARWNTVYDRGLFTVTLPAVVSYWFFGHDLWAMRLPGVVFNVLGVIPLYLITRRINHHIAIISCFLFVTSPYLIAFSRNIREYAYYPFYFYWVAYFMLCLLQSFPDRFMFFRDWKMLQWKHLTLLLLLALPFFYVLVIDRFSTFKLILLAYGLLSLFLFAKFDLHDRKNWFLVVVVLSALFVAVYDAVRRFISIPSLDFRSLEYFFLNPPQQWYFDRVIVLPILVFLLGWWCALRVRHISIVPMFLCCLYAGYMFFFILFFEETGFVIHPRFVLVAQLWFIPILSIGIYVIWLFVLRLFKGRQFFIFFSILVFIILTFNPLQVLFPTFFRGEYMPITDLAHDNMKMANQYMLEHANEKDVLIGGLYQGYVEWQGDPVFEQMYFYSSEILKTNKDGFNYIASIIEKYPSGWIVIDNQRLDDAPPSLTTGQILVHGKIIEYIGKFTSQNIWRWSVK